MFLQKSSDKINKMTPIQEKINLSKMFKSFKENSISRPVTSKTYKRKPPSSIARTQSVQPSFQLRTESGSRNKCLSISTMRKFYPSASATITPKKKNVHLHILTNTCLRKVYEPQIPKDQTVTSIIFEGEQSANPENGYSKKRLKTCRKKRQPYFKKTDLQVRIQGIKVF